MSRSPWKHMPAWAALIFALAAVAAGPATEQPDPPPGPGACVPAGKPYLTRKSIVVKKGHFGEGYMEAYPDAIILKLHGLPYEMGYQHGAMLKDEISQRVDSLRKKAGPWGTVRSRARAAVSRMGWPARAREEVRGMARGSGIPAVDLAWLNLAYAEEGDPLEEGGTGLGHECILAVYHSEGGVKTESMIRPGEINLAETE